MKPKLEQPEIVTAESLPHNEVVTMTQSTVEERRKRFIEIYQSSIFDSSNNTGDKLFEYMESELQLAEQKAMENVTFNDL